MKRLDTLVDVLALFDASAHENIINVANREGVDGVVIFENVNLDSTACGSRTACIFGPGCTIKTIEQVDGMWLNDLPSQRQYPQSYWKKGDAP